MYQAEVCQSASTAVVVLGSLAIRPGFGRGFLPGGHALASLRRLALCPMRERRERPDALPGPKGFRQLNPHLCKRGALRMNPEFSAAEAGEMGQKRVSGQPGRSCGAK